MDELDQQPDGPRNPRICDVFPSSPDREPIDRGANRARLDPGGVPKRHVLAGVLAGLALAALVVGALVFIGTHGSLLGGRDLSATTYSLVMAIIGAVLGLGATLVAQRVIRRTGAGFSRHPMRDWADSRRMAIPRGRPALPRLSVFGDARRRGTGMWATGTLGGDVPVTVGEVAAPRRTPASRGDRRTYVLIELSDEAARLLPALSVVQRGTRGDLAVELHPLPREGSSWPDRRFEVLSLQGMPPGIGRLLATSLLDGVGERRCAFWEQRGTALALWVPGWHLVAEELDQLVRDAWETAASYERLAEAIGIDARRGAA